MDDRVPAVNGTGLPVGAVLTAAVVLMVVLTVSACTSESPPTGVGGLDACPPLPQGIEAPADVALPDGMVVTEVSEVEPLVQVTGLVDATPVEIRRDYADDPDLAHIEDEGFEAEILLTAHDHRTYVRAQARCRTGSIVTVIRVPEDQAGRLPVPGAARN